MGRDVWLSAERALVDVEFSTKLRGKTPGFLQIKQFSFIIKSQQHQHNNDKKYN